MKMTRTRMIFETSEGKLEYDENTLLIFIDETGNQLFSDKKFPIFGLGGCIIQVKHFNNQIAIPWNMMKEKYFNGANKNLHAADLRNPLPKQIEALNYFFSKYQFGRIACLTGEKSLFPKDLKPYQVVTRSLWERIRHIIKWIPCSQIFIIFEHSNQGKELRNYFASYKILMEKKPIPIIYGLMDKTSKNPGLEVADFIIHTAGGQAQRIKQYPKKTGYRKDFEKIFKSLDHKWVSFFYILGAKDK